MSTEIRFYHLRTRTPDQALPEILTKAVEGGRRVVVRAGDESAVAHLNDLLWTFQPDSFLPHGAAADGHAAEQPIWLTTQDENPNSADVLVLACDANVAAPENYELCCMVFDGHDETAVVAARTRWKEYKNKGFSVTYWKQTDQGGWEKTAA